jgi:hypothetical protein
MYVANTQDHARAARPPGQRPPGHPNAERQDVKSQANPDSDNYLGEPPAEVTDLVANLIEAAVAVEPAVTAWQETGCEDPLSLDCGAAESLAMDLAVGDLTEAFDAWAPYL